VASVLLQATNTPGRITVVAELPGFASGTGSITSEASLVYLCCLVKEVMMNIVRKLLIVGAVLGAVALATGGCSQNPTRQASVSGAAGQANGKPNTGPNAPQATGTRPNTGPNAAQGSTSPGP